MILDNVVGTHKAPEWLDSIRNSLLGDNKLALAAVAGIATVLIAALGAVASYIDNYYTESVGQWVAHDCACESMTTCSTFRSATMTATRPARCCRPSPTTSRPSRALRRRRLDIFTDLLTIIGMFGLMLWLEFDFALIAVGVSPFLLLFVARLNRVVKRATHEVRHHQSDIVAVVEKLESIRVVKAFGRQELEESRLDDVSRATVDAALQARRVKSLLSPAVTIVVALCTGFVLWRGTALVLANVMTVGALTVFLAYLSKFFKPVQDLAKMSNTLAQTAVAMERVQAILDTHAMVPERPDARGPELLKGGITFDHVGFGYDPAVLVLKDVNFSIAPGQLVGVVGATGGGKSTVVGLIPRFYDPAAGRVLIDGVDLRDLKVQGLRKQIGFVLQDTVLFRGTVRDNIAYGRPDATDEEIVTAAKLANADEFIARMPKGYDSMVGERGLTLSGGQRQRIGIARAIIRNAPILILDEPTAALDTESEKLVIDALERLMKGRTVITIAHRLSTIRDSDKILVLKDGVVFEEGTHDELVARDGFYAELYRVQFGSPRATLTPKRTSARRN